MEGAGSGRTAPEKLIDAVKIGKIPNKERRRK